MRAKIDYRIQMEVTKCNTEVAMEAMGEARNLMWLNVWENWGNERTGGVRAPRSR